jgi:hypothetical protein
MDETHGSGRRNLGEIDVIAPAALEVEARGIRFRKIPVVEYDWEGDDEGPLAPPGSATVFIAKKGSPVLKEIRAAAKARNGSDAGVARKVFSPFRERRPMELAQAVQLLQKQPVFASVQYGGLTLATSLFVDAGLHACVVPLPYNGGRLAKEGFTLVEHVKDGSKDALDAVVLVRSPPLTAAERAAVRRVPASQLGLNVGKASDCWGVTAIAAVAVVVLAAVAVATLGCHSGVQGGPLARPASISADRIKKLGPAATARELLRLRREAFHTIRR